MQGHPGARVECDVRHVGGSLPLTTQGPDGLHNVGDARGALGGHGSFYASDPTGGQACHGQDLAGTVLSRAAAERVRDLGAGHVVTIAKGQAVRCGLCHAARDTSQAWVSGDHGARFAADPVGCEGCHGADLAGTSITIAAAARSYPVGGRTSAIAAGTQVGCATGHVAHATDTTWVATGHKTGYLDDPDGSAISKAASDRSYTVSGKTYLLASGMKVGCANCHVPHATTSTFATTGHAANYESDPAGCRSCHGTTLGGTVLSKAAAARSHAVGKKTVAFAAGEEVACAKCHVIHATDSTFAGGHESAYKNDQASCRMCHGNTLNGTSLSVTSAERTVRIDGRNDTIPANTKVACDRCHEKP